MVALPVAAWSGDGVIRRMAPLEWLIRPTALNARVKLNGLFACIAYNYCAGQFVMPALLTLIYANPNKSKK